MNLRVLETTILETPKIEYETIGLSLIFNPFALSIIRGLSEARSKTPLAWQLIDQSFLALYDIHRVVRGKLKDWKEEEHAGEKLLFEIVKRKGVT